MKGINGSRTKEMPNKHDICQNVVKILCQHGI